MSSSINDDVGDTNTNSKIEMKNPRVGVEKKPCDPVDEEVNGNIVDDFKMTEQRKDNRVNIVDD